MLKKIVQFVLRDRKNAIFTALLLSVLPLLNWLSFVIVGLVTLQKGAFEGFLILLWASLPVSVLLFKGIFFPFIYGVLFGSLFVWLLAILLKRYENWLMILEFGVILGVMAVVIAHLFMPNIDVWWTTQLTEYFKKLSDIMIEKPSDDQISQVVSVISHYATGLRASGVLFLGIISLMLARFLQSANKWFKEWAFLRLNYIALVVLLIVAVFCILGYSIFKDILPVVVLPFLLVGTSVVHSLLKLAQVASIWMILFYISLAVMSFVFPLFWGLFVLIAMIDSVFNIRRLYIKS